MARKVVTVNTLRKPSFSNRSNVYVFNMYVYVFNLFDFYDLLLAAGGIYLTNPVLRQYLKPFSAFWRFPQRSSRSRQVCVLLLTSIWTDIVVHGDYMYFEQVTILDFGLWSEVG